MYGIVCANAIYCNCIKFYSYSGKKKSIATLHNEQQKLCPRRYKWAISEIMYAKWLIRMCTSMCVIMVCVCACIVTIFISLLFVSVAITVRRIYALFPQPFQHFTKLQVHSCLRRADAPQYSCDSQLQKLHYWHTSMCPCCLVVIGYVLYLLD